VQGACIGPSFWFCLIRGVCGPTRKAAVSPAAICNGPLSRRSPRIPVDTTLALNNIVKKLTNRWRRRGRKAASTIGVDSDL
jgi:hypothetical protein